MGGLSGLPTRTSAAINDPVAYYPLDGTTASDNSGNGNDGSLNGSPATGVPGVTDDCFSFDGDDDYISCPTGVIDGETAFTISAWVNANSMENDSTIVSFTGNADYGLRYDASGYESGNKALLKVQHANGSGDPCYLESESAVQTTDWQHVAVTYDATNGYTMYVNGTAVSSGAAQNAGGTVDVNRFDIGRSTSAGTFWDGRLDEIRAYNRELTSSEIESLFTLDRPTSAHYPLDGSTAADASGRGNDGTVNGPTTGVAGIQGTCFTFDGSNDHVDCPTGLIDGNEQYTVSAWIKADTTGTDATIVGFDGDGDLDDDTKDHGIRYDATGFQSGNSNVIKVKHDNKNGEESTVETESSVQTTDWQHIAVTYAQDTGYTVYADSQQLATGYSANNPGTIDVDVVSIGQRTGAGTNWSGKIDEVRFFDTELGPDEVNSLYRDPVLADVMYVSRNLADLGDNHQGLIPGIIDWETLQMYQGTSRSDFPDEIQGQRPQDRVYNGANISDEKALLQTFYSLDAVGGGSEFASAADDYLDRFANHCTNTTTGLWPHGEHSYWHLVDDRVGNAFEFDPEGVDQYSPFQEHIGLTPKFYLDEIQSARSAAIQDFADGIDYHWTDKYGNFNRQAPISDKTTLSSPDNGSDFPRHSGFYIHDLSYAYAQNQRSSVKTNIEEFLDYWWDMKHSSGLLPWESSNGRDLAIPTTLSLAVSLLDAAEIIEPVDSSLASTMRTRAREYGSGVLSVDHDTSNGILVQNVDPNDPSTVTKYTKQWDAAYGDFSSARGALLLLSFYRHENDSDYLDLAKDVGDGYLNNSFPATATELPAGVPGKVIDLLLDLHEITDADKYLDEASDVAASARYHYFRDTKELPRSATSIDYYESAHGTAELIHGLARLGFFKRGEQGVLAADYTSR